MREIFVNLKRFEVSRDKGGLCPIDNPRQWIKNIMKESVELGIGRLNGVSVIFLVPESLILTAKEVLSSYPPEDTAAIGIGCQGVYRENIKKGGNFGAFTTNTPAASFKSIGCTWSVIGHSEERRDKLGVIDRFESLNSDKKDYSDRASKAVNSIINEEVICALEEGINVLLCVGETAKERGDGSFEEQKPRIQKVLEEQLLMGLEGAQSYIPRSKVVIAYEPIWAIGPGKTPPGAGYIGFVSSYIKSIVKYNFGFDPVVVYGGGLKEENAGMISKIESIGGGLIALTKFSGEIGFYVYDLKKIIEKYIE